MADAGRAIQRSFLEPVATSHTLRNYLASASAEYLGIPVSGAAARHCGLKERLGEGERRISQTNRQLVALLWGSHTLCLAPSAVTGRGAGC